MNDDGGCRQQLVIRQEIYFRDHGNIALNIQVFTSIFRQVYCALICRIRPHAAYQLSGTERRLQGWMRLVAAGTGPQGPAGAEPCGPPGWRADRPGGRGGARGYSPRSPASRTAKGRRLSEPLHAQLAGQG
jgi:hypothetical protein